MFSFSELIKLSCKSSPSIKLHDKTGSPCLPRFFFWSLLQAAPRPMWSWYMPDIINQNLRAYKKIKHKKRTNKRRKELLPKKQQGWTSFASLHRLALNSFHIIIKIDAFQIIPFQIINLANLYWKVRNFTHPSRDSKTRRASSLSILHLHGYLNLAYWV